MSPGAALFSQTVLCGAALWAYILYHYNIQHRYLWLTAVQGAFKANLKKYVLLSDTWKHNIDIQLKEW